MNAANPLPPDFDDLSEIEHDRSLVARLLSGDERAFERFAADYVPIVYRFAANRLGGDRELTREISQTTLTKAIAKLSTYRGESALTTWLCACCKNEIAAHFRAGGNASKRAREVEIEALPESALTVGMGESSIDQQMLERERRTQVHEALDGLPPRYGQALEWKYLEGLSVEEIASRLTLTAKAAESLLTRARSAFRQGFSRLTATANPLRDPNRQKFTEVAES